MKSDWVEMNNIEYFQICEKHVFLGIISFFHSHSMSRSHVQQICCFGAFGCVTKRHQFVFTVYEDSTLSCAMKRASRRTWNYDVNEVEGEDDDDAAKDDPVYSVMNGQAWVDEESGAYKVKFTIGKHFPNGRKGSAIACKGCLSPSAMTGTFQYLGLTSCYRRDDSSDEENDEEFELFTKEDSYRTLSNSLLPLTPGDFKFTGCALTDSVNLLFTSLTITLHPDGTVTGEVDQAFIYLPPSPSTIEGKWTQEQILFSTTCRWNRNPDFTFRYKPSLAGLRGSCRTPKFCPFYIPFMSAVLDLSLEESANRAWCPELNPYFPNSFKTNTRLLLLSSLRGNKDSCKIVLPNDLWKHVLRFTNENWFDPKPKPSAINHHSDAHLQGCAHAPTEPLARFFREG